MFNNSFLVSKNYSLISELITNPMSNKSNFSYKMPSLSDGFIIPLLENKWGALFPRQHLMLVSPDKNRVRTFINNSSNGYEIMLTDQMKDSFIKYYTAPNETINNTHQISKGEVLGSAICILPTNDCNLGCKYCFTGTVPQRYGAISWEIAKAAIDLAVRNAIINRLVTSKGKIEVRFFGGGEPTAYWDIFATIVEYAKKMAIVNNLELFIGSITNGQIEEKYFQWFKDNISEVSISMDGPPDIQNEQRPTYDGKNSFEKSWKFLSAMDNLKMNINPIRITITANSVNRMEGIAEFFWNNLSHTYPLQFEPVYISEFGRRDISTPKVDDFIYHLRNVEQLASKRNIYVGTVTKPLVIRQNAYCDSLEGKGIFITPEGFLSLCSEISLVSDPRKDKYFIGKYDNTTNHFSIFEESISKIQNYIPARCKRCFAQFSCCGGCTPRSLNADDKVRRTWCALVKKNLMWTWKDVQLNKIIARARFGNVTGDELIWLPIWKYKEYSHN